MHVLMISDVYFPRINGVSTSIQTFRSGLDAENVHVTLVVPDYNNDGESCGNDDKDIIRIAARRVPFDPEDRLMQRRALSRLDHVLDQQDFDLIHIQTPFTAHYTGLKLAKHRKLPCIATYHTHFEEYFHHYLPILPRPMARSLTRRIARSQCNALDAVIVPSLAMQQALHHYGVTAPTHILPTGIPLQQFAHTGENQFRQRHGISPDCPLALYVGRVAHEKNLRFLLEAMAKALTLNPSVRLVIAGEGPALAGLKRLSETLKISHAVIFVGYLDRAKDLPECYAAADLFVFPSTTETQGLVLLEAMAGGLPALGIPAMGAADIIGPERGAVCAPHNQQGFAELMVKLLADPERLATLSQEAQEFAKAWDAPARTKQLASLYQHITTRHKQ